MNRLWALEIFFGSMPDAMQNCKLYGVEMDDVTGRIAKQLYQNANITIAGFEDTKFPDNFLMLQSVMYPLEIIKYMIQSTIS